MVFAGVKEGSDHVGVYGESRGAEQYQEYPEQFRNQGMPGKEQGREGEGAECDNRGLGRGPEEHPVVLVTLAPFDVVFHDAREKKFAEVVVDFVAGLAGTQPHERAELVVAPALHMGGNAADVPSGILALGRRGGVQLIFRQKKEKETFEDLSGFKVYVQPERLQLKTGKEVQDLLAAGERKYVRTTSPHESKSRPGRFRGPK